MEKETLLSDLIFKTITATLHREMFRRRSVLCGEKNN